MRVTLNMLTNSVRVNLSRSAEALMDAQNRASSGKRLRNPSDDVAGAGRAIRLRSAISYLEQLDRNSGIASNLMSVTEGALTTISNGLHDARKLAAEAATDAMKPEARMALATQVQQIIQEVTSAGNTHYLGRYIFSGSLTDTQAVLNGPGGGPPHTYQGDTADFHVQIAPGVYVTANVTGDRVFNIGGVADPAVGDLFQTLEDLKADILAADSTAVSNRLKDIDLHLANVTAIRSEMGGRINRLEAANNNLLDSKLKINDLLSKTEDADTVESMIDLQTRQNVYQAAIATATRVLETSLANMWK